MTLKSPSDSDIPLMNLVKMKGFATLEPTCGLDPGIQDWKTNASSRCLLFQSVGL